MGNLAIQYNTYVHCGPSGAKTGGTAPKEVGGGEIIIFSTFRTFISKLCVVGIRFFFIQSLFLCSSFRSHPLVCSDSKLVSTIVGAQDGWRGWDWVNLFSGVWIESDYLVVDDRLRNSGQIRLRCFSPWVLKIECCSYVSLL